MTDPGVTSVAVVLPARGSRTGADATIVALERQTVRPTRTVLVDHFQVGIRDHVSEPRTVGTLADALRLAAELGDPWLWLLNSGVVPEPTALEKLVGALADMDPRPVLLASRVLTPDGGLEQAAAPVPVSHLHPERVLAAVDHRYLAVRVARSGSLLVQGLTLERLGVTSTSSLVDGDIEWTARLLSRQTGVLVPASVAISSPDERPIPLRSAYARIRASVRMVAGLDPEDDRVWFAVHLAERGLASVLRGMRRQRRRSGRSSRPRPSASCAPRRRRLDRPH